MIPAHIAAMAANPDYAQTGCAAPSDSRNARRCKACDRPLIDWHVEACDVPGQMRAADRYFADQLAVALATTRRQEAS